MKPMAAACRLGHQNHTIRKDRRLMGTQATPTKKIEMPSRYALSKQIEGNASYRQVNAGLSLPFQRTRQKIGHLHAIGAKH